MNEINHSNFEDFPMNKYLILIDSIGLRSRRAVGILTQEGYLPMYVEGGFDMFLSLIQVEENSF
jgi:rhodanese-related sulfurtransferase